MWIKITTRKPPKGQSVLITSPNLDEPEKGYFRGEDNKGLHWYSDSLGCFTNGITHWQLLPKNPKF